MSETSRRPKRIAQTIRDYVANFLVSQVRDDRLKHIVVTEVRVSDDLSMAWIGVRLLMGQGSEVERRQCVKQLQLLAGRLRRLLGPVLGLRRVPELRFQFDVGLDAQQRVEEILKDIGSEPPSKT